MDNDTSYVGSIYGLTCSCEPEHIRYVGLTTKTLGWRVNQHVREARVSGDNTRKLAWIRKHLALGHEISAVLIDDQATSFEELDALEIVAMWACRRNGHHLTNSSLRGWSILTYSEETRAKMSESTAQGSRPFIQVR